MYLFSVSHTVFYTVKLFSWGWLLIPLMRNSHLLCLMALNLKNVFANKGYSLTNEKRFVSVGHRFSTASKGMLLFLLCPTQRPEQSSYQGSKSAMCSIQNVSHPVYYYFFFPRVYQLQCNNFYGSFCQTSVTQFTYPSCLHRDRRDILLESYMLYFSWDFSQAQQE